MKIAILTGLIGLVLFSFQGQTAKQPAPLELNNPAPSFRLNDHTDKSIAVGVKQKHWTVLAFYPKALTPG